MNPKVSKEQIIAYLYGELTEEEAEKVATYLRDNPQEAAEYEAMQQLRSSLQKVKDVEVPVPVIMLGSAPSSNSLLKIFQNPLLHKVAATIAVIFVVLILARLTGLHLTYNSQALTIAFSKNQETPMTPAQNPEEKLKNTYDQNFITQQQLMEKVSKLLVSENQALLKRLASLEFNVRGLEEKAQHLTVATRSDELPDIEQQQVEALAQKISDQNLRLFSQVIKASQMQQEAYIKSLFSDFAIYLQSQRVEDLKKIEAVLVSLKQESDLKKLETDQVITRLIQTVNDKKY